MQEGEGSTGTTRSVLLKPPFRREDGNCWIADLQEALAAEADCNEAPQRSRWLLYENDTPVGPPHQVHAAIREAGAGRHSHWGGNLYFSTSDNSDPNTNGRRYVLADGALALGAPMETPAKAAGRDELFQIAGSVQLLSCPICGDDKISNIWRLPQTHFSEPVYVTKADGSGRSYLAALPTLRVPQQIYCFDICDTCETIFLNPKQDDQSIYCQDDSKVVHFKRDGVEPYRGTLASLVPHVPRDAQVILDAACGAGQSLQILRESWPATRLIGLELSQPCVDHMRACGLEAYAADLDVDDLRAFAAPDTVDFILFSESFEHVRKPMQVTRKLVELLRPGGRMLITAQWYSGLTDLQIRVGEPIYISEGFKQRLPELLGCKLVKDFSGAKAYMVIERTGPLPPDPWADRKPARVL